MLEVAAWALEPSPAGRGRWRAGAEARRAWEQLPPPRGRPRPRALPPASIHLSKLIFDIHSDLEGRHGDNSQKVENNIIATNMNYWPPG